MTDVLAGGASQTDALAAGFERGLQVAAVLAAANLVLALQAAPRVRPDGEVVAEAVAGAEAVA